MLIPLRLNTKQAMSIKTSIWHQRGISLIELIMFIVIVSVSLAGILLVMNLVTRHSADPLIRKQALAVGESMLEEIKLQPLSGVGCAGALGPDGNRTVATSVCDYANYRTTNGILDFSTNQPVAGLNNYNVTVAMNNSLGTFGGTPVNAGSAVEITVAVTDPAGETIDVTGYRVGN